MFISNSELMNGILLTGFIAGAIHVFMGADHMAAIAPFAVWSPSRAWTAGLRWGIGHASGVGITFLIVLILREFLKIEMLSTWSERLVGLTLIGMGLWALRLAGLSKVHTHEHIHGGIIHEHIHIHASGQSQIRDSHFHGHTALAVGVLHGIAGGSHFLGVLPALAFPNQSSACAYILAFGVGAIAAMVSFSLCIGWLAVKCAQKRVTIYRQLLFGCALIALTTGGLWILQA